MAACRCPGIGAAQRPAAGDAGPGHARALTRRRGRSLTCPAGRHGHGSYIAGRPLIVAC